MSAPILATKLYIPTPPPQGVSRPRLIERLNEGLDRKLTLISAPAGFGKTTLVSAWVTGCGRPVAWLSLDDEDSDITRFLTYLIAALRTVTPNLGEGVLGALQSPQPAPSESILTSLLNEIIEDRDQLVLVLDDYHVVDSAAVDRALTFLLGRLPPQMSLVLITREDPQLPLARLRARGQLAELRAADLRFTASEAADFLNRAMGLNLPPADVAALERRTEGWVAGLQLAAISMHSQDDSAAFIESFTGSHRFVMDYLVEEVLQQQPEHIQVFLLRTSILDRLCGPLCDAVVPDATTSGQATLQYLERANLFVIPLDHERRWYRYHHLFADLLRQRLHDEPWVGHPRPGGLPTWPLPAYARPPATPDSQSMIPELHKRASQWYEDHGFVAEAFHHAVAANDAERTIRIIQGRGIPLHFRGVVTAMTKWLESQPKAVLDARPSLWATYASLLLVSGQSTGVEEKLQAAEAALLGAEPDERTRDYVGQLAAARATLALSRYDSEAMLAQSRRALEYLRPDRLSLRANAHWTLGYAYLFGGDRIAAHQALTEAISLSQAAGNTFTTILATTGLGNIQEAQNQLYPAADTYRRILQLAGDQPLPIIGEVHLGLARILYEWNDLEAAEQHGRRALQLQRQYDRVVDRFIVGEVFLARVRLAQGDVSGAAAILAQAAQSAHDQNFVYRIPEVAAAQVRTWLRQGNVAAAAHLAQAHNLPLSLARVNLAQQDTSAALAVLDRFLRYVEARDWADERLNAMVLRTVALWAHAEKDQAMQVLSDALALAAPGGFIRSFLDEGAPMAQLLGEASARGMMSEYVGKLLAAFEAERQSRAGASPPHAAVTSQPLVEPLSRREIDVLQLIAQGLSNREISDRLFLALDTVKGHNRRIFEKLQVQRRTEAVARARELGLL